MKEAYGYLEKFDLSKRSSIKLGPLVDAFFPSSEEALVDLLYYLEAQGRECVIGGGLSNILPSETSDLYAYVFSDALKGFQITRNTVTLGAGCRLGASILRAAREGRFLLPSLIGIPGTVGGAIYSNAGAYGEQIGTRVLCCRIYDRVEKTIKVLSAEQMMFSYRHSILKERPFILLDAVFSFDESLNEVSFKDRIEQVKEYRKKTQPHEPSLGCVFKAHAGVSVGYYLDRIGMKGYTLDGIAVSEIHAGFLINRGGSIGAMKRLIVYLKRKVSDTFGFVPEEEIIIL